MLTDAVILLIVIGQAIGVHAESDIKTVVFLDILMYMLIL